MSDQRVVVVGAGHAAAQAAESLRTNGWEGEMVLVGGEDHLPYHRPPLSKKYFDGNMSLDQLHIKPPLYYQEASVELRLGQRAKAIDRSAKCVLLESGERIDFSKLVLATGTRPRRLPLPGADHPAIFYLRTLTDVDRIRGSLRPGFRLLIVGAGYIGLELAASAVRQGCEAVVLEAEDRVLARVTCPIVSRFYERVHTKEGVDIRLSTVLEGFESAGPGVRAMLAGGETLDADCVVIGIGVLPNVELAEEAGLACENGILVDEYCRTEDPDIYAIGDCSNHPSPSYGRRLRLESVPNALEQAKVAALSICGTDVVYDQVPWFWSDQYEVKLQTVGLSQGYDEAVVRGDPESGSFAVFYLLGGRLIAVDAINSPVEFMVSKRLVAERAEPDSAALADPQIHMKSLLSKSA